MHAGRPLELGGTAKSSQVATLAISGAGIVVCPVAMPAFFGFGPAGFLAIYRMAYERAIAEVSARPTWYDRLQHSCWN